MEQGLALYRQAGDRSGEIRALGNLGILHLQLGRYREATGHLQQALDLLGDTGDQVSQGLAAAMPWPPLTCGRAATSRPPGASAVP